MTTGKDTIYIDIDDEITSIIDKLRSSPQQIVALVLPKRATMLQSSVNMKLLKRAADTAKKNLVLVTTEAGLMPLAGAVGLHVAKTPQSKPEIPTTEPVDAGMDEALAADEEPEKDQDFDASSAAAKPVGELSGLGAAAVGATRAKPELAPMPIPRPGTAASKEAADETIQLDSLEPEETAVLAEGGSKLKDKKLKVPNFEKFRLRLILGGLIIIVLIVGWVLANIILPKATITVATNASTVNTSLALTLDTGAKTLDQTKLDVPATIQSTQKTATQQVPTTGQQNNGTKASGQVTLSLTDCSQNSVDIPAGSGVTTAGLTFITQADVTLNSVVVGGKCKNNIAGISSNQVNVISINAGSQYNVGPSTFTVNNHSNVSGSSSSAMTGGTDNIIQIVAQADIDSATAKLTAPDTGSIKSGLEAALQTAGLYPVAATFNAGAPATSSSANVGDQASTVTVTQTTTYTMFGVKQSNLQQLLAANINKQINTSKQSILDDGFGKASFSVTGQTATAAQVTMQTTATAGPHLDVASLKTQIVGKKAGDIKSIISANPGVTGVSVKFSPFWVSTAPKVSKITINIEKPVAANAKP